MAEQLREPQQAVVDYSGGRMGVSAVPGSGKTLTLSYLASELVARLTAANLEDQQEVLIVTFTNSAVNTFRTQIARRLQQERGMLPYVGYRVRTLHGLAHDIVRMRPGLVGLSEGFEILDERASTEVIHDIADRWLRANIDDLIQYVDPGYDTGRAYSTLHRYGRDLVEDIAGEVIRLAKDNRWDPDDLRAALDESPVELPLAQIGIDLFSDYQRGLTYRGGVDFDDLVRLAMQALEIDSGFLERLRAQWRYILEDESQDSSRLQNDMLRLLSGGENWVRVGDPNQAIFTTFTTADSNFLRRFLVEPGVADQPLPHSGRSAREIIALANHLVEWVSTDSQAAHLRDTFYRQAIEPTPPGDPQPNPAEGFVHIDYDPERPISADEEIRRLVTSLARWWPEHRDWTAAVLVPENQRGFRVAEALKEANIPYEELLRSTTATRTVAEKLYRVLDVLAHPIHSKKLAALYEGVWWPWQYGEAATEENTVLAGIAQRLGDIPTVEGLLWPGPEGDLLSAWEDPAEREDLARFRGWVQQWMAASSLPIDQLILTLSRDLFKEQADLALGYKLATVLRSIAQSAPSYRLRELGNELRLIASNQRRFLGFDDAALGYAPQKGVVTIATMHAAKGLEWDRVYLLSVNTYSFPAALPGDPYIAEKWFVRGLPEMAEGQLNLQAEARRQVELLMEGRAGAYEEGEATKQARIDYAAERLRLLYVGITRAKRDLILMWNTGRRADQRPAAALVALWHWWQGQQP
jgi:DNA helicase-2/ATP-dependent DNA helicase PcrA